MTIAPGRALATPLIPAGADQTIDVGLHQHLQHRLRHAARKISVTRLLQQLGQRQSSLYHRILSRLWLKCRDSTVADQADGHLRLHRDSPLNLHHVRGR
jgi:hypothetical protein